MPFKEYGDYDGVGLAELVRANQVSAREVVDAAIERAEAVDPQLNFLTHRAYEAARAAADDPALPDGPLKGVPWLMKELASAWEGHPITNCCPYPEGHRRTWRFGTHPAHEGGRDAALRQSHFARTGLGNLDRSVHARHHA